MGWQWHQLDHMQIICTLLQTDNHASTSPLSFYRPDALPAAQPTFHTCITSSLFNLLIGHLHRLIMNNPSFLSICFTFCLESTLFLSVNLIPVSLSSCVCHIIFLCWLITLSIRNSLPAQDQPASQILPTTDSLRPSGLTPSTITWTMTSEHIGFLHFSWVVDDAVITCVCLSVHSRMLTLLHGPRSDRGCPLVLHYWADLQSVHGLHCYGNITRTRNVSEYMLVLALRLVFLVLFVIFFLFLVLSGRLSWLAVSFSGHVKDSPITSQCMMYCVVNTKWPNDMTARTDRWESEPTCECICVDNTFWLDAFWLDGVLQKVRHTIINFHSHTSSTICTKRDSSSSYNKFDISLA